MLFYVEKENLYRPTHRTSRKTILVDTASVKDIHELEKRFKHQGSDGNEASMLTIEVASPPWRSMREGAWYDVDPNIFADAEYRMVESDEPGSGIIRAEITFRRSPPIDFSPFLASPQQASIPRMGCFSGLPPRGELELVVINCGQGNWNEIRSKNHFFIYDIGASLLFNQAQVQAIVASRNLAGDGRIGQITISHWDVDHYRALLELRPSDLNCISSVTVPSQIPDTATYKRTIQLLQHHSIPLRAIPPAPRPAGTGRTIILCPHHIALPFHFYRAVPGQSRNQAGIVVAVVGSNRTALLTGDHHYSKIDSAVLPNLPSQPLILVAPHHGGAAGALRMSNLNSFPSVEIAISVGCNTYGHPLKNVERFLSTLQGSSPDRTDLAGSLTYKL
ncbi:ComEC/Rec2 family competence protein [Vreelandella aquamarina]|uniref:Metal-dependent hydrolase, beta-lactamase superfamily II n=1 Tax=Vreelandella aquamarina TaxID=77097 RepID=A0A1H8LBY2_9GAMM|nr:hypothetical protein [Halomonas aquamarina]SEO02672.1 Metal-dependent hydrolase, beta-lactamase superfamily II [Halomonas aquamarina]